MASPLRFTNGISTVVATDPLAALPYPDPTTWGVWAENFIVTPNTSLGWTLTQTNGTIAEAGIGPCGGIALATAGADNDLAQLALTVAQFTLASGKKFIFEAKAKLYAGSAGTLGQLEAFIGMSTVQVGTNFFASDGLSMVADNCIGFNAYDGSAAINANVRVADVESVQAAVLTLVDNTFYVFTIYFDGTSLYFYVDGTLVTTLTTFPTAALTPTLYVKAGEGGGATYAKTLTALYMLVARER